VESVLTILSVSQDPANYEDAPTEGIRRVLEIVTGAKIPRGEVLNTDKIGASLVIYIPIKQPTSSWLHLRLHPPLYNSRN
jgi:hypothetical protein